MSIAVEYLGFRTTADCREYLLRCRTGADRKEYTVGIAHETFASGRAKYQDGPAICYAKLERELQAAEPAQTSHFEVSEEDLQAFQAAHASPQKKRHKAAPPAEGGEPAPEPER
ncbi:MAG TPA: hypothetical protein VFO85_22610 [Vicinamibacteria bacterium]|nr:hypothetical protein [Vicinamibacteria bacterium]